MQILLGLLWVLIRAAVLFSPLVLMHFKIVEFDDFRLGIIAFAVWFTVALLVLFWREIATSATSGPSISIDQWQDLEDATKTAERDKENDKTLSASMTPGTIEYMSTHYADSTD